MRHKIFLKKLFLKNMEAFKLSLLCQQVRLDPFLLDFGLGQLASFMFIFSYKARFYMPNIIKVHPPISRITACA